MWRLWIYATIFIFFVICLNILYPIEVKASEEAEIYIDNTGQMDTQDASEINDLRDEIEEGDILDEISKVRLLPGTRRNIVVMGAFATLEEPKLSTEVDSSCPIGFNINQRYVFSTSEKVFIGLAIKNTAPNSKSLKVAFLVTGPLILKKTLDITIAADSICLPVINLPTDIPTGLYKIFGFVPGRGEADAIIEFRDDLATPTPTPMPTPTP